MLYNAAGCIAQRATCKCTKQGYELQCIAGISEPLPVAATFHMPDVSGNTMDQYATIDTMVCNQLCHTDTKGLQFILFSRHAGSLSLYCPTSKQTHRGIKCHYPLFSDVDRLQVAQISQSFACIHTRSSQSFYWEYEWLEHDASMGNIWLHTATPDG